MWKRLGTQRRIADRSDITAQQRVRADLMIVERSDLHEEIVRVLPVNDWFTESGLALLKEFRVETPADCRRLKAEHGAQSELAGAICTLRHRHKPVHGEKFVGAARTGLLLLD